jgi:hypothetical protein
MSDKQVLYGAAGLGVLGLLYLFTRNQSTEQPRYQTETESNVFGMWDFGHPDLICEPEHHLGDTVVLPCRFPHRSGHNISSIIHRGFDQLYKSRPQDSDWMFAPPSEDDL